MDLRKTINLVHNLLEENRIPHAMIGGLALSCYGSTRATVDLDILVDEVHIEKSKELLLQTGFKLVFESSDVLQFDGIGYLDILIARRPISRRIIQDSNSGGPEGINFVKPEDIIGLKIQAYVNDPSREFQDKADIGYLIQNIEDLDWERIKTYADLFNKWDEINDIKNKVKL